MNEGLGLKKVLFVATVTSHINTFHIPYLKWFKEQGYEVHVASKGEEPIEYCDKHFNVSFERFPLKPQNLKAYKELKKIINENQYEIIHCHTPVGGVLTRLVARKARKKYNTKVIYTAHGFHFYKGAPKKNWLLFYPLEWYLSKYTDTLITINQEDFKRAQNKFGKRCKDIQYVPGVGIDTKKFDFEMPEDEKIRLKESLGLKKDDFVLTCVARLDKNKNQGFLIKCMHELVKEHKNIHLLLAGRDEINGYYQKMTKDLKLENNVHFLGNRSDIPQLLKITNILISASIREGLGMNLIEALYSNVPVIATDNRGHRDIVNKVVNINDIEEFCINVEKCKKDNTEFKCENICRFELKNILKRMEKIYKYEREN